MLNRILFHIEHHRKKGYSRFEVFMNMDWIIYCAIDKEMTERMIKYRDYVPDQRKIKHK